MKIIDKLRNALEKVASTGKQVECACCGRQSRRFWPAGVINKRENARCAWCGSLERHRLVALQLKQRPIAAGSKILIIAPEAPLLPVFKSNGKRVTTADLFMAGVDVKADICALPFAEDEFAVVVANHVLEHIADDGQAMRELRRVTKAGGRAILQTPLCWQNEVTEEEAGASEAERVRRFGQADHVRLYGRDFVSRLEAAGWHVAATPVNAMYSTEEIARYGLESDEVWGEISCPQEII